MKIFRLLTPILIALVLTAAVITPLAMAAGVLNDGTYYYASSYIDTYKNAWGSGTLSVTRTPPSAYLNNINTSGEDKIGLVDNDGIEFEWDDEGSYSEFLSVFSFGAVMTGTNLKVRVHGTNPSNPHESFFRNAAIWTSMDGVNFTYHRSAAIGSSTSYTYLNSWVDLSGYTSEFKYIGLRYEGPWYAGVDGDKAYIDAVLLDGVEGYYDEDEDDTIYTCTTIPDWHFSGTPTDTWTLNGGAEISTSMVTLPTGGAVSQSLISLVPNKTYNLLVSVSTISPTPTITDPVTLPLLAELGDTQATLSITGTDVFTAGGLSTTGQEGDLDFILTNTALISSEINIDWACLYDMGDADKDIVCIAPTNGEFTTDNHWDWFYNAEWNQSSQNAYLPYNDTVSDTGKSLVVSTGTYSLPELITDTYLILAFDSMALGQNGIVSARAGDNWHEFDVNSSMYRFEADISTQAGLSITTVSFANAGAPDGEFAAIDDLTVDNVCIYVSDSPPNPPEPLNPWLDPFSFGFNFTCPDVPALLAGYNIDVYTPTAAYEAGVSSWTEEYWVPWLAGALWVNVGSPLSCFIVEFMRLVAAIGEQLINAFTNTINWWYQTLVSGVPWLQNGMFYPAMYGGYWLTWYANNSGYGIIEQQNTMSLNTMDVGLETGSAINQIMNDLIWMWNESVIPWMGFSATASNTQNLDPNDAMSLSDFFGWLTGGIMGLLDLIWAILSWLVGLILMAVDIPFSIYHSMRNGISGAAYAQDDVMCVSQNFWCYFWAGVYLVNEITSNTIVYPFAIFGIIIITIVVVSRNIYAMFSVEIG